MEIPIPEIELEKQAPNNTSSFSNAYHSRALMYFHKEPKYRFWLKNFTIPGFSTTPESIDYPTTPVKVPGTDFIYEDLATEFHLDEDFVIYGTLFNKIFGGLPGPDFVCPRMNGSIIVLDNSQKNVVADFLFHDLQALGVNSLTYETQGIQLLTLQITFSFNYFKPTFHKTTS